MRRKRKGTKPRSGKRRVTPEASEMAAQMLADPVIRPIIEPYTKIMPGVSVVYALYNLRDSLNPDLVSKRTKFVRTMAAKNLGVTPETLDRYERDPRWRELQSKLIDLSLNEAQGTFLRETLRLVRKDKVQAQRMLWELQGRLKPNAEPPQSASLSQLILIANQTFPVLGETPGNLQKPPIVLSTYAFRPTPLDLPALPSGVSQEERERRLRAVETWTPGEEEEGFTGEKDSVGGGEGDSADSEQVARATSPPNATSRMREDSPDSAHGDQKPDFSTNREQKQSFCEGERDPLHSGHGDMSTYGGRRRILEERMADPGILEALGGSLDDI